MSASAVEAGLPSWQGVQQPAVGLPLPQGQWSKVGDEVNFVDDCFGF